MATMIEILIQNSSSLLIRLTQDIRMENAHFFLEEIKAIGDLNGKNIYLDFSKVQFVDSSGIGTLLKVATLQQRGQGSLNLVNLNRSLSNVFKLSGLFTVFQVLEKQDLSAVFPEDELQQFF